MKTAFLSLAAGLVLSITASANTFYVSTSGADTNPGSQSQPWRTIQKAVDTIAAGDTIIVKPGSYAGCRIGKSGTVNGSCTLMSETPGSAIINALSPANRHQSLIEIENFSATIRYWVIDGFELAGAQRYGIDLRDTDFITIQNCKTHNSGLTGIFLAFCYHPLIQNNESYSNGEHGIYQSNSGDFPTIVGNKLHDNFAAGLHMNGDQNFTPGDGIISFAVVEKNIIWENGAGGGSGINCDGVSDSVFRNNLLYNNHASGISLYAIDASEGSSRNRVYNNTIVMPADGRWCVNIPPSSSGRPNPVGNDVRNNILYTSHTFRGSVSIYSASAPGFSSDYNVVVNRFSTDDGDTNRSLASWQALGYDQHSIIATPDQLFSNAAGNDYSLKSGSPAIDAGVSLSSDVNEDITGAPRPRGPEFDIGCYEAAGASGPSAPVSDFMGAPLAGVAPLGVQFTDQSSGAPSAWAWSFGDGGTSPQRNPSHTYTAAGSFTVSLTVSNAAGQTTRTRAGYVTAAPAAALDYFCQSLVIDVGKLIEGDHASVHASDDSYLRIKASELDGAFSDVLTYTFDTRLASLSSLAITSQSRSKGEPVRQQIFLFNYSSGGWESIDDRAITTNKEINTTVGVANPARYLSAVGEVRVRIQTGDVSGGRWKHFVNLVKITAAP